MPCYDGRAPEPTKKQRVGWEAEKILCKQCRELHAAGQLDSHPELKSWFIKHLAGDVFWGTPANPQVDLDRILLGELLADQTFPVSPVIHTEKVYVAPAVRGEKSSWRDVDDIYYITKGDDGYIHVHGYKPYNDENNRRRGLSAADRD